MRIVRSLVTKTRLTVMVAGWVLAVAGVRRRSRFGSVIALAGLAASRAAYKAGIPSLRAASPENSIRLTKVA
jgi:hypothetical protein